MILSDHRKLFNSNKFALRQKVLIKDEESQLGRYWIQWQGDAV